MNTNLRYGYFVALLALCVGVPLLATGLWHYALPTLLVAALVLWREWRLDPAVPFLFSALVFGMFTLLHGLVLFAVGTTSPTRSAIVFGLLLSVTLAALQGWRSARRQQVDLPDILAAKFEPDEIQESNELQWAVLASSQILSRSATLDLYLQNCVNTERQCRVAFEENSRAPRGQGYINYPEAFSVTLAPGEVVLCRVPVWPTPRRTTQVRIYVRVDVSGARGRRNRSSRGNVVAPRASEVQQALALANGSPWNEGVSVAFQCNANIPAPVGQEPVATFESLFPGAS